MMSNINILVKLSVGNNKSYAKTSTKIKKDGS